MTVAGRAPWLQACNPFHTRCNEAETGLSRGTASAFGHEGVPVITTWPEVLGDRDRIARDLHDHVIQGLFALGLAMHSRAAGSMR
jgi:hypothetical protein